MREVQLLKPETAKAYQQGHANMQGNVFEHTRATGKATCRGCGGVIAKGEACLVGYHDFGDGGTYTSSKCYLHTGCDKEVLA